MCGCFDIFDFVCFFTFFITAIVSLLFVQYFFVYLDFETDEKNRTAHFGRCLYFLTLTFLGCLVFAGVQRRSICLLKWPSRVLVSLITIGLIFLTLFLWTLDRVHKISVRDLELKTVKLSLVIILVLLYLVGVQKLINLIQVRNRLSNTDSNANLNYVFGQNNPNSLNNLMDAFRTQQKQHKSSASSGHQRPFNADINGINYYKLLLEGNNGGGISCSASRAHSHSKMGSLCSVSIYGGDENDGVISQV